MNNEEIFDHTMWLLEKSLRTMQESKRRNEIDSFMDDCFDGKQIEIDWEGDAQVIIRTSEFKPEGLRL